MNWVGKQGDKSVVSQYLGVCQWLLHEGKNGGMLTGFWEGDRELFKIRVLIEQMGLSPLVKLKCGQGSDGAPEWMDRMVEVVFVVEIVSQHVRAVPGWIDSLGWRANESSWLVKLL